MPPAVIVPGAANVPLAYLRAAKSLGLTRWQQFFRIIFPAAIPQIFTGLRVAMALSWAVVVAAELTGAQEGLGYMISDAAPTFRIPTVFIGIAIIGAIVGEFLGAQQGLGLVISTAQNNFDPNGIFAAMLLIAVVALTAEGLISQLEKRLLSWRPGTQAEVAGL